MKILLYDMGAFTQNDLIRHLKKRGATVRNIYYKFKDVYNDDFFVKRFGQCLAADDYDFVMSINFFPLVAGICHKHNIRYLSWSYDSPLAHAKRDYFHFPTSHIFLFDRIECEELWRQGFRTVRHLPLGVDAGRMGGIRPTAADIADYGCDVSLVGQIYRSQLEQITAPLAAYDRGFIDSIVASQLLLYGCYLADGLITPELVGRIREVHGEAGREIEIDCQGLSLAIATRVSALERMKLMELMGARFGTALYSRHVGEVPAGVSYRGTVNYFDEMPLVFRLSRINLNPTLRNIRSGIPLRALDILASQGLLLSNYQPELVEHFIPGEDVVIYESPEDAVEKADFYLRHEEERSRVAANGHAKVRELFSFAGQLGKMFAGV